MGARRLGPTLPNREGLSRLPLELAADGALQHIRVDERLPVAVWHGARSGSEIDGHDSKRFARDVRQALLKYRRDRLGFAGSDGGHRKPDACGDKNQ